MKDQEFILAAKEILTKNHVNATVCSTPENLHLGAYSYVNRSRLLEISKEILKLEGYTIREEVKRSPRPRAAADA